ncbi:MAG: hypothetical protein PHI11_01915 [Gallionella sp.]|nr:hypothetical protein [Gallionella sp.]
MAQFISFDINAEVSGEVILSALNTFPEYHRARIDRLMQENNIVKPAPNTWFKQQNWLSVLKGVATEYGAFTLFELGVAIPEKLVFPPQIIDLESALRSIDVAYNMNHRNGQIGYYKLLSFDAQAQKAVMECKNPYPCHFDRGIITTISRKFLPSNAKFVDVQLEKNKPSRLDGADTSFYEIIWF